MRVEWDEKNNLRNLDKHGIGFEQAQEMFLSDSHYIEIFAPEHVDDQDRFVSVGATREGVVVVVWTERDDETIRIISARRATR